jgi:hypothetical protein
MSKYLRTKGTEKVDLELVKDTKREMLVCLGYIIRRDETIVGKIIFENVLECRRKIEKPILR